MAGNVPEDPGDVETTRAEASLLTKVLRTKLVDNRNEVEVQQSDPTSPLYSAKSFEELRLLVPCASLRVYTCTFMFMFITTFVYTQKTQFTARGVRDEVQQTQQDTRKGTSSAIG